ncbi:MAG: hypothetical protein MJA82_20575 [Clostridia bacterium]|nr:hypothetical protein [Clostridia bacterium]
MERKVCLLLSCILILACFTLVGCGKKYEPVNQPEETPIVNEINLESTYDESASHKSDYEVIDGDIADFLSYNYQNQSMYIAGLKVFEEFGTSNEGFVSISTDENVLTFGIIKATGSVTGAVDGPSVYFKMDLDTNKVTDKEFEPAPNYAELGITEFIKHSKEVIELTDERMVEIGKYFDRLIQEIEKN